MRESFVIHFEYIEDLPESLKQDFLVLVYNYGIKEEKPTFTNDMIGDLKKSLWLKIQRRIDGDIFTYEEQKRKKQEYKKKWDENRRVRKHSETFEEIPPYTDTNTHSVSVSDSVSVFDSVSVSASVPVSVSDAKKSQQDYARNVYNMWKTHNLPCSKDEITFSMRDMREGLEAIHKGNYTSQEVEEACKNYIKELEASDSFVTSKMTFAGFCKSKLFSKCLPDLYRHENFQNFKKDEEEEEDSGEIRFPELDMEELTAKYGAERF